MAYYSPETVDETRGDDGAKPGQRIYFAMHSSVGVQSTITSTSIWIVEGKENSDRRKRPRLR